MYGIGGEHDLSERELPHLRGWRDSRPVRVGNGAWDQTQLDVYGELLNALHLYRDQLGELHPEIQAFVADLADAAAAALDARRDAGMWEMRGEPRHHLSSKVLCWTALDRAVKLAPAARRVRQGRGVGGGARPRSATAILERGWSEKRQAYAQSFDSDELDAAALLMPILGFLPATDERMRSTIEAIARDLTEDGLVLRYRNEEGLNADGLDGRGGHVRDLLVLARVVPRAGGRGRARARRCSTSSPATRTTSACWPRRSTPRSGELLGNFPQAFSHIGLITAAYEIDQARGRAVVVTAVVVDVDAHEGPVYVRRRGRAVLHARPARRQASRSSGSTSRSGEVTVVRAGRQRRQRDDPRPRRPADRLRAGHAPRRRASPRRPRHRRARDGRRRLARLPLNSPNDVVVKRDGTIWFTDPSYGYLQGFRPEPAARRPRLPLRPAHRRD